MVPNGEKPISGAFQIGLVCIIIAQRLSFVYFINGKYCFHLVIFVLFSQRLGTVQQGQEYSSRFRENKDNRKDVFTLFRKGLVPKCIKRIHAAAGFAWQAT